MAGKNDKHILLENFIATGLTQIISYIIPLISLPYLSRVLGPEKFGLVFWAQATIQYFIILTDFGFNLSAVREISVNRHDMQKINEIFSSVMIGKIILILISFILLHFIILLIPKFRQESLLFYLTFLMVIGNAIYPIWFFQGIEHMKYITFLNILAKSIFLVFIFIFVKEQSDYLIVAVLNSFGFIISGLIGIYLAIKRFNLRPIIPSLNSVNTQLRYSFDFFLSRLSASLCVNTNTFIIGLIGSPVAVAYYTSAEKIYQAVMGLTNPINQVLYPYVSRSKNLKTYKKIFYLSIILLLPISILMFIFSKSIIVLFYGTSMLEAYIILRIFCITMLIAFISALVGYPLLAALGHTKEANYSIIFASVFHIFSLLLLNCFKLCNIYNVAFLTILTEGLILLFRVTAIKKYKLWNYNNGNL